MKNQTGEVNVKMLKNVVLMTVLLGALCACQALGIAPADTFNKKWAEAQQTDTAVLSSALTLTQSGKLTPDQLHKVEMQTDNAKAGLDLARQVHASNPKAGSDRLSEIIAALGALQTALSSPNAGATLQSVLGK